MVRHHILAPHSAPSEVKELYVAMGLKTLGISLVSVFIPIYLYKLGYSIQAILVYFITYNLILFVVDPLAGYLLTRWGSKKLMVSAFGFVLLNLSLLATLPNFHWPLVFVAITLALYSCAYDIPYHVTFSRFKAKGRSGGELGAMQIIIRVGGSLGPLIGGAVATSFGIGYAFIATIVLLIAGGLFLLISKEIPVQPGYSLRKLPLRKMRRDLLSYGALSIDASMIGNFWPFFLFLVFVTYAKIGLITTLSFLFSLSAAYLAGRLTDRGHQRGLIRRGSTLESVVHVGRTVSATPFLAGPTGIVGEMSHVFILIPWCARYYSRADEFPRVEYVTAMEMMATLSRFINWVMLLAISYFVTLKWLVIIGFIIAAASSLLIRRMPLESSYVAESKTVPASYA